MYMDPEGLNDQSAHLSSSLVSSSMRLSAVASALLAVLCAAGLYEDETTDERHTIRGTKNSQEVTLQALGTHDNIFFTLLFTTT